MDFGQVIATGTVVCIRLSQRPLNLKPIPVSTDRIRPNMSVYFFLTLVRFIASLSCFTTLVIVWFTSWFDFCSVL